MSSSTNLGRSERAAHSADNSFTCCSEGTFHQYKIYAIHTLLVKRSQKRPSGRGSFPPGALGSSF